MDNESLIMILHGAIVLILLALSVFKGKSGLLYSLTCFSSLGWFLTYWEVSHYIAGTMLIIAAVSGFNTVKNI